VPPDKLSAWHDLAYLAALVARRDDRGVIRQGLADLEQLAASAWNVDMTSYLEAIMSIVGNLSR
jgi:hypothetical protein